jgi:hypothetical protein
MAVAEGTAGEVAVPLDVVAGGACAERVLRLDVRAAWPPQPVTKLSTITQASSARTVDHARDRVTTCPSPTGTAKRLADPWTDDHTPDRITDRRSEDDSAALTNACPVFVLVCLAQIADVSPASSGCPHAEVVRAHRFVDGRAQSESGASCALGITWPASE